jgi:hypothetical protein
VDRGHQVGAVVERDLRPRGDDGRHAGGPGVDFLAVHGVNLGDAVDGERRRDVVLRGQRVRRAQRDLRAARPQRAHEVRRLGGHVQARPDGHALKRPLDGEALRDRAQHGHLRVGPLDAGPALLRERDVGDVGGHRGARIRAGPEPRA